MTHIVSRFHAGSSWPSLDCIRASAEQDPSSVPSSVAEAATAAAAAATGTTTAIPAPSEACRREVNQHGPLRFSIAMWTDELASFIEQVVGGAAYVTGNSLGMYQAKPLALCIPCYPCCMCLASTFAVTQHCSSAQAHNHRSVDTGRACIVTRAFAAMQAGTWLCHWLPHDQSL